jgi:hypothetical protein
MLLINCSASRVFAKITAPLSHVLSASTTTITRTACAWSAAHCRLSRTRSKGINLSAANTLSKMERNRHVRPKLCLALQMVKQSTLTCRQIPRIKVEQRNHKDARSF